MVLQAAGLFVSSAVPVPAGDASRMQDVPVL